MNNEINKTIQQMAVELSRFFFFLVLAFAFFSFILGYLFKGSSLSLHCMQVAELAALTLGVLLVFFLPYDYFQEMQKEKNKTDES